MLRSGAGSAGFAGHGGESRGPERPACPNCVSTIGVGRCPCRGRGPQRRIPVRGRPCPGRGVCTFVGQALGLRRPRRPPIGEFPSSCRTTRRDAETASTPALACHRPAPVRHLPPAQQSSGTSPLSALESDRRSLPHDGPLARSSSVRTHLSSTAGHRSTGPDFGSTWR